MAAKKTAVSDEEIIAALLSNGTIAAAAGNCGLSPRSIYDRMSTQEFNTIYSAAKADILRTALVSVNSRLSSAISTISEIMDNAENNPAIRLQAAQALINTAGKFTERLNAQDKKTFDTQTALPFEFFNISDMLKGD